MEEVKSQKINLDKIIEKNRLEAEREYEELSEKNNAEKEKYIEQIEAEKEAFVQQNQEELNNHVTLERKWRACCKVLICVILILLLAMGTSRCKYNKTFAEKENLRSNVIANEEKMRNMSESIESQENSLASKELLIEQQEELIQELKERRYFSTISEITIYDSKGKKISTIPEHTVFYKLENKGEYAKICYNEGVGFIDYLDFEKCRIRSGSLTN